MSTHLNASHPHQNDQVTLKESNELLRKAHNAEYALAIEQFTAHNAEYALAIEQFTKRRVIELELAEKCYARAHQILFGLNETPDPPLA
jgi:hypothetical protein